MIYHCYNRTTIYSKENTMTNMFNQMTEEALERSETPDDFKRVIPVVLLNVRIQYRNMRIAKKKQQILKLEQKRSTDHIKFAAKLFRHRIQF